VRKEGWGGGAGGVGIGGAFYREGRGEERTPKVGAGAPVVEATMNAMELGGAVSEGEGEGPRRWSGRRRIEGGRGGGAGRPGRRAGGAGGWGAVRPGLGEEGGGRRWKTHLTGGSHLSARGRERRGRGGPVGLIGPGEIGGPRGGRMGRGIG
jgi:hypothetical protein